MSNRPHKQPNILLIVVDCLRADRCPADGDGPARNAWPTLRRWGTTFTQMISAASTTPVCFASMLTGQYPFVHGITSLRASKKLNPAVPTLAEVLSDCGYTTYARMTGPVVSALGFDRGFDEYQHRSAEQTVYGDWGKQILAELAGGSLQEPWFMLLHLFELHRPRQLNGLPKPRSAKKAYDLAWQQLDAKLAELLQCVGGQTLIILTSDHGEFYDRRSDRSILGLGKVYRKLRENFNRPRRVDEWKGHGFHVFEELIRIPLCIAGPGVQSGLVVDDQVRQVDLMPTILELAGCDRRQRMHGRSLVPAMRRARFEHVPAYVVSGCEHNPKRNWHCLRHDGWKYAEHPRTSNNVHLNPMLFDLRNDPQERRNLINAHPDVALSMRSEIDRLLHDDNQPAAQGHELSQGDKAVLEAHLRSLGYI